MMKTKKQALALATGLFLVLAGCGAGFDESAWKRIELPETPISLESPGNFKTMKLELPAETADLIHKQVYYKFNVKHFESMAAYAEYVPSVIANLQGAADGSMQEMSRASGVSNLKYAFKEVNNSGLNGLLATGTFQHPDGDADFKNVIFTDANRFYQLVVIYSKGDEKLAAAAQRMIDSLKIKKY